MKQNVKNTIQVSSISEVQILNMMKKLEPIWLLSWKWVWTSKMRTDARKEVDIARESLHNAMRALGVMHAYEVETNASIKSRYNKGDRE